MSTATPFLGPIDLGLFEIQNAIFQQLPSDPGSPAEGQFWENTMTHEFKWFNGTDVIVVGSSDAAGTVTSVAVESANGFAGTVADDTADAAITLTTTVASGSMLKAGSGGQMVAGAAGTDYVAPTGSGAGLTGITESQVANLTSDLAAKAPLASPALTGTPTAPTASALTDSTQVATTAYADSAVGVEKSRAQTAEALLAPLASPALTGNPTAPTQTTGDSSTKIATDAFVAAAVAVETSRAETAEALLAPLASPTFTGTPAAPTPTTSDSSTKIATTAFVQAVTSALAQGIQFKPTATVVATSALPSGTYSNGTSGVGATFTVTATGTTTVDGHVLALNDLVLLTAQASSFQNGLYTVTTAGTTGVSTVLTRHADMDQSAEFPGAFIPAGSTGTSNYNSLWLANPSGTVTVGTTAIPLTQINGAADLIAGAGLAISGNTVAIENSGVLTTTHGGTGGATVAAAKTSLGFAQVYNSTAIGDGSATTLTVTHSLNNAYPAVTVWLLGGTNPVIADCRVESTGVNTVSLIFGSAPASSTIRCTVTG